MNKSLFDLDEKIVAALAYLFGPITGFIILIMEKENRFVRFHALQSLITFGGLWIVGAVLRVLPFIGFLGSFLLWLSGLAQIAMLVLALLGGRFKIPVVGDVVEAQIEK